MFKADPNNAITWWTYIATILIAICIYLIFRQRQEIPSVIGFKNKSKSTTKSNSRISIIPTNKLNLLYSNSSLRRASIRIDNLILQFNKKFSGDQPDFIIRAPGRVNLIGEHIDYCGYNVLPMAIEKDILFAVKVNENHNNIIQLCNRDQQQFTSIQIDLSSKTETNIKLGVENRHWSIYFLAAFHGVCNNYCEKLNIKQFKSLQILVDGNIPKGSGLSSSSAFVCGSAVSLLFSNLTGKEFFALNTSEIAEFCIECERFVGVDSGGMDQTICMTANKGYAKYIEFVPDLQSTNVKLPSQLNMCWVISNCLVEHKLQDEEGTHNYNTRVVECRLAAVLLAKLLKVRQWRQILTFRDVQNITKMKLDELLFRTMDLLNDNSYSIQQIEDELECQQLRFTLEDLMVGLKRGKVVMQNLRSMTKYRLPLQKRALHVYGEAHRVMEFRDICMENFGDIEYEDEKGNYDDDDNNIAIKRLGKLMNNSHLSCRDKYECSCDELDELQSLCIDGGAVGARLTGAGWGGCIVSLVEMENVKKFKSYLNKNYYASIPKVPLNHQFSSLPSNGLCVLQIVTDE